MMVVRVLRGTLLGTSVFTTDGNRPGGGLMGDGVDRGTTDPASFGLAPPEERGILLR